MPLKKISLLIKGIHSDHYAIAQGFLFAAAFGFLGKIFGAAKEMAIADRYGISPVVDAYIFVFNLASWPVSLWFSVLTVILVPVLARERLRSMTELMRFKGELLGFSTILGMVLMVAVWFTLHQIIKSSWVGLPAPSIKIAEDMIFGLAMFVPIGLIVSLMSIWVLAYGSQLNTLFEGLPALVIFFAIMIFPPARSENLVWGTFVGYVFNLLFLIWIISSKSGIPKPVFIQKSKYWSAFWGGVGVMIFGQFLMSFITIIDQFYAAHLDAGSISTLSYANRIMSLILSLGAIAISRATLPIFSRIQDREGLYHLKSIAFKWMAIFFVIGVGCTAMSWFFSNDIVRILFERGLFTSNNTNSVSSTLQYYLIQAPFYFSGLVLVSLFASLKKYYLIAASGIINLIIKLIANFFLIPIMGINGIALSTSIMYVISLVLMLFIMQSKFMRNNIS